MKFVLALRFAIISRKTFSYFFIVNFIYFVFLTAILLNGFKKLYMPVKINLIIMEIEFIKNNYYIVKLSQKYDLNSFSCGLEDMDDFLKNDALIQQEEKLNVTYLVICDNELIGFFSLLSDIVKLEYIGQRYDFPYGTCPAIKIGRFAVNEKYSSLGLGTVLLDNVCYQIKRISELHGVRFITVDAYCDVRGFYYKNEFNHFNIHNEKN